MLWGEALAFFITLSISRLLPAGKLGSVILGVGALLSIRSLAAPATAFARSLLLLLRLRDDILIILSDYNNISY